MGDPAEAAWGQTKRCRGMWGQEEPEVGAGESGMAEKENMMGRRLRGGREGISRCRWWTGDWGMHERGV